MVVLAYNTVQLADTVPASTGGTFSGAVTINGAFTSQGIDDNADATAITIDSSEDVTLSGHLASGVNKNIDLRDADGHVSGRLRNVSGSNNALTIEADPDNSASGSYVSLKVDTAEKFKIDSDGNTKIRNANATGPILDIGTTSTSVADDGVIGGIDFTSGSSSTVNGRLHCKQYDTSENAGYFSNELRAPNGNSLGEVSRELMSQNAIGGVYIKRPMPGNMLLL